MCFPYSSFSSSYKVSFNILLNPRRHSIVTYLSIFLPQLFKIHRKITIFRFLFFSFHLSVSICLPGSPESKPNFITLIFCSQRIQFSFVQLLSRVWLFVTPWTTARQASLSITNSQSSLKFMSIKLVMPFSHLILCCPLLLLPPIPPGIKVFSNESTLRMRWPKVLEFQL